MSKFALACFSLYAAQIAAVTELELIEPEEVAGASGKLRKTVTTFIEPETLAWDSAHPDGPAMFQDFPQHYLSTTSFQIKIPKKYVARKGTYANYRCTNSRGPCNAVVFLYECAGCGPEGDVSHVVGKLSQDGFKRTRCAPTFTTGKPGGKRYQMSAFVKTLEPSEAITITLSKKTNFVAFALSNGGMPECPTHNNNQFDCDLNTDFRCQMGRDRCEMAQCRPKGPILHSVCTACPLEEFN